MGTYEIWLYILSGLCAIIGYLLNAKDVAQDKRLDAEQKRINDLFAERKAIVDAQIAERKTADGQLLDMHVEDAQKLQALELQIANNYYKVPQIDGRFDKFETIMKNYFGEIGNKMDRLTEVVVSHVAREDQPK